MKKFIKRLEEKYVSIVSLMLSLCLTFNFMQVLSPTINIFAENTQEVVYGDINNDNDVNILE